MSVCHESDTAAEKVPEYFDALSRWSEQARKLAKEKLARRGRRSELRND